MADAGTFTKHEGDTDPMVLTCRGANNAPADLRGATVTLSAWRRGTAAPVLDEVEMQVLESEGTPELRGKASAPVPLAKGTYVAMVTARWVDPVAQRTFPNSGPFRIRVTKTAGV